MKFKKIICGLLFLSFIFGTGFSASAIPMRKILQEMDNMGYFGTGDTLDKIKERTVEFLREERKKGLGFYDRVSDRVDSLAFVLFCYLCICEEGDESVGIKSALNKVCSRRDSKEHHEDMAVINDILPQNIAEFAERFGIWLDESKRSELSEYVGKYVPRSVFSDSDFSFFRRAEVEHRKGRKPGRELREIIHEGMELAEEGYDCDGGIG